MLNSFLAFLLEATDLQCSLRQTKCGRSAIVDSRTDDNRSTADWFGSSGSSALGTLVPYLKEIEQTTNRHDKAYFTCLFALYTHHEATCFGRFCKPHQYERNWIWIDGCVPAHLELTSGFTVRGHSIPDEQCFETMKAAIDAGATFWNAGVFYGQGPHGEPLNLRLISRYFTIYPDLAGRVFLSVKGGLHMPDYRPDGSPEFLRKEVDGLLRALEGRRLNMFECARVDQNT